jgi:hypothetical protein
MAEGFRNDASPSAALTLAARCLGGRREWRGRVRGLLGLIAREFTIRSDSHMIDGALCFSETMRFDDGEVQERSWRLFDGVDGVGIEGEGISQISPGRSVDDEFIVSYCIRFGAITFNYRDRFRAINDTTTENFGVASVFGAPLLKISCIGVVTALK